ncbi:MAG: hypothetical protein D6732_04285, partial [Methanobacteriota archaeon]
MPLTPKERAEKIREAHHHLKQEMANINQMICENVTEENFEQWRLDLLWRLRDFLNHLQKHFDLEEEGGFMSDIVLIAPHQKRMVDKLADEHEKMVDDFTRIISKLKKLQEKDDD